MSAHHSRETDTGFTLDPANLTPRAPPAYLALRLQNARWGGTRYHESGARAERLRLGEPEALGEASSLVRTHPALGAGLVAPGLLFPPAFSSCDLPLAPHKPAASLEKYCARPHRAEKFPCVPRRFPKVPYVQRPEGVGGRNVHRGYPSLAAASWVPTVPPPPLVSGHSLPQVSSSAEPFSGPSPSMLADKGSQTAIQNFFFYVFFFLTYAIFKVLIVFVRTLPLFYVLVFWHVGS